MIFNKNLYRNAVPDHPGGGTVIYSNPWKEREYVTDIAQREDGGTPPFLQGIKAAMCIRLKEEMGVANILQREEQLLHIIFSRLINMKHITILEEAVTKRLGVVSFIVENAPYNLIVKLLNDRFGIQVRGGCSCAGTYGHMLLDVDQFRSHAILDSIRSGDLSCKPGWIRLSIHPTMTDTDVVFMMDAIEMTVSNVEKWGKDYGFDRQLNEYFFREEGGRERQRVASWFDVGRWC